MASCACAMLQELKDESLKRTISNDKVPGVELAQILSMFAALGRNSLQRDLRPK